MKVDRVNYRNFSSTVFNENCKIIMAKYPDKYFDIAIVDTPYGINAANMQMGSAPNRKGNGQYPGESTAVKLKKGSAFGQTTI